MMTPDPKLVRWYSLEKNSGKKSLKKSSRPNGKKGTHPFLNHGTDIDDGRADSFYGYNHRAAALRSLHTGPATKRVINRR
jgi:hypothetical protein